MDEWWRGSVTYQIYPRSFQDSNGDGVGDLPGITARLDHVAALGVDAIWLSPIFPSPMADMGYDVSDYTDIDPVFGSLADFDAMVAKAHDLGLKVIIDQVLSHSSDRHPWFVESRSSRTNPRADWYVWTDPKPDGSPPSNWLSVFGGSAWEWDAGRRQYYLHNFLTSQPDLNFHNPAVQDALLGTMRFWLERGVDGFRLDTVNYYVHDRKLRSNPPAKRSDPLPPVNLYDVQDHRYDKNRPENIAFLNRMRALLDEYAGRTLVGEVGETSAKAVGIMAEYTKGDDRLHMAYSFDMLGNDYTPEVFRSRIETFFKGAPDGWPCWSFSNHDVVRHATRWGAHGTDTVALARQAAAMLLSFRGSVCLYQGEELGLTESELEFEELTDPPGIRFWPEYKGRDGCRTPMPWEDGNEFSGFSTAKPWLPIKPAQAGMHVKAQTSDEVSVLSFYRRMLAFRRTRPELRSGSMTFFRTDAPVLAYLREADGQATAGIFNLSPTPVEVSIRSLELLPAAPGQGAVVSGKALELAGSGFAFLAPTGGLRGPKVRFKRN